MVQKKKKRYSFLAETWKATLVTLSLVAGLSTIANQVTKEAHGRPTYSLSRAPPVPAIGCYPQKV